MSEKERTIAVADGLRIVIIDDNEDVTEALKDLLEETGHRVWSARTGLDGVDLVQEIGPNVVLCDLSLPHMDGLETCRRIRALPIAVRPLMVAITGWGRDEDIRRTREAGFDHHLVKPLSGNLDRVLRGLSS
ncbi:MAG TPA: response regulator [Polyangia bacterium]|nr:response regulator [Polyangia bacterium]